MVGLAANTKHIDDANDEITQAFVSAPQPVF